MRWRSVSRKDIHVIKSVNDRLMYRLMKFLFDKKPLVDRPKLGPDFLMANPEMILPAMVGERYRMAVRMGGARTGKEVGEHLMEKGIREDKAIKLLLKFLEHCKVGKVKLDETMRIRENCESLYTKYYETRWEEPACYFTTGFLNGFFSTVKNQHVKETKCIAMGDPYCEWEFR
jgi:predicted hydrocarbon binding protein